MLFSKRTQGHLIALMTVFLWGTTFIATKVLLTDFKPIEILFFRFGLGHLVLWILSPRFFAWQGGRREFMFLCAGLCGVTCYFLCENIAYDLYYSFKCWSNYHFSTNIYCNTIYFLFKNRNTT
ncbi:MAG: EamA family transporter [Gilliamella sp.]|nr:EamA family transporter [Gilliamella sp.]MCO6547803.1 EamA family transporter [Gilliamella sp.]